MQKKRIISSIVHAWFQRFRKFGGNELVKKQLRFEKFSGNDMEISAIYGEAEEDSNDPGVLSSLVTAKAKISFDTSGGTQHIISSLNTVKYDPETYDPKTGLQSLSSFPIGWNGKYTKDDVEYAGVDIIVSNIRKVISQTIRKPTTDYENIVIDLTGTVNDRDFLGRKRGEVLFLGASWTNEGGSTVNATYNFAIRRNENKPTVLNVAYPGEVKGWEYIWSITNFKSVTPGGKIENEVKGIYVSQVYKERDFRLLGIRS